MTRLRGERDELALGAARHRRVARSGPVPRPHRGQRVRQVDAAEDPDRDHGSDRRSSRRARARGRADPGDRRDPPGAQRPGEHLALRVDPRSEARRDRAALRRDRRVRRAGGRDRPSGEVLFERHADAPGVHGGGLPATRHLPRRRGAVGRRRHLPGEVARSDARGAGRGHLAGVRLSRPAQRRVDLRARALAGARRHPGRRHHRRGAVVLPAPHRTARRDGYGRSTAWSTS